MTGAPTIADVARLARLARVSSTTVSRVVNEHPTVHPRTREQVRKAVAALDYVPNAAARSLSRGRHLRLGILYAPPPFGIFSDFLIGTVSQGSSRGVELSIKAIDMGASPRQYRGGRRDGEPAGADRPG